MSSNPSVAEHHTPDAAGAVGLSGLMRRGQLFSEACPSREVLQHVTSRWGVLLLVALMGGTHRFSDLRRKVGGVSEKMLAQTLRWLEADGFVLREARATVPPHVEYRLTPMGREVGQRVEALADWIECALPEIMAAQQERAAAAATRAEPSGVHRLR